MYVCINICSVRTRECEYGTIPCWYRWTAGTSMQTSQPSRRLFPFLIMPLGRVRKGKLPQRCGQTYLKPISTISTPYLRWPSPDRFCFLLIFHRKLSYFYDYLGKIETRGHEIGTDFGPRTLLIGFSKTSLIRPRSCDRNFWPLYFKNFFLQ